MILDKNLVFCEGLELSGGSGASDVVDLLNGGEALGRPLDVVAHATEDADGGTKITLAVQTSDDASFSSPQTLYVSPDIAAADIKAGKKLHAFKFPRGAKRYVRVYVTCTGTFTAGAVSVFCVAGDDVR